jgi:hypothetical protein
MHVWGTPCPIDGTLPGRGKSGQLVPFLAALLRRRFPRVANCRPAKKEALRNAWHWRGRAFPAFFYFLKHFGVFLANFEQYLWRRTF